MTAREYAALPAFFRQQPKAVIEQQYARNAEGLRRMLAKAERTGRKVNGYTAADLRAKAERYEALSRPSDDSRTASVILVP